MDTGLQLDMGTENSSSKSGQIWTFISSYTNTNSKFVHATLPAFISSTGIHEHTHVNSDKQQVIHQKQQK